MSNLNEYALIIATFISGNFLNTLLGRLQNEAAVDVILGVKHGIPMSTEIRSIWLLQVYLGMLISMLVVDLFLIFGFMKMAAHVDDAVAPLGYLAAAIQGFHFVGILLFGVSGFVKQLSLLR